MKMQPKLRLAGGGLDYTQEKLDMQLIKEVRRRNKKDERERLMKGIN